MRQIHSKSGKPAIAVLVLALASVALAACGGSSGSSSSSSSTGTSASSNASASATTSTPTGAPPGAGRFTALRECLKKDGITLPERKPGQQGGGFFGGTGGPQLPAGVTRAQFEAALKKCGGGFSRGSGNFPARRFFNSPALKQAYAKFAACMRENGINLPEPNTSGKGPIFNTKGINTASTAFKNAESKCRSDLASAFRARPGASGAGAGGGGAVG